MKALQWMVLVLCGFVLLAFADENDEANEEPDLRYSAVYQMPAWVQQVHSLCPWQSKSDDLLQGHVRLTHGRFADQDRLYVQWLKKQPNNYLDELLSTREIEELNKVRLRIAAISPHLASNQCELTIKAKSLDDEYTYRLEIQIKEPGRYQYLQIKELSREQY